MAMKSKLWLILIPITGMLVALYFSPLLRSTRANGWTLISISTAVHEPPFSKVYFFDHDRGIALAGVSLQRTKDGGATWVEVPYPGIFGFYDIHVINWDKWWILGSKAGQPVLTKTEDGGRSWAEMHRVTNVSSSSTQ